MVKKHEFSHSDAMARLNKINQFEAAVVRVAQQQQVSHILLKGIMAVESSGNPLAGIERTAGAKGLMQIIDQTWRNTIQRFPNVYYQGLPLTQFIDREANNSWQNPELNILIGALAIKLKAAAMSKHIGKTVSPAEAMDMVLILTAYNAGEFTTAEAYNNAIRGGSSSPQFELLDPRYLQPAIQTVVTKFKLGWDVGKKYDEISEYAGKVLGFMDLLQQQYNSNGINLPNPSSKPTNTPSSNQQSNPNPQPQPNPSSQGSYTVVAGDTGMAIAKKLKVSFELLQKANPNVSWSRISIGQKINIPNSNPTAPSSNNPPARNSRSHVVKRGDNLANLATLYKTSIEALKAANSDKLKRWGDVEGFSVGDTIIIP